MTWAKSLTGCVSSGRAGGDCACPAGLKPSATPMVKTTNQHRKNVEARLATPDLRRTTCDLRLRSTSLQPSTYATSFPSRPNRVGRAARPAPQRFHGRLASATTSAKPSVTPMTRSACRAAVAGSCPLVLRAARRSKAARPAAPPTQQGASPARGRCRRLEISFAQVQQMTSRLHLACAPYIGGIHP